MKWKCPSCGKPEVMAVVPMGWRDCRACGWQERLPVELEEAVEA